MNQWIWQKIPFYDIYHRCKARTFFHTEDDIGQKWSPTISCQTQHLSVYSITKTRLFKYTESFTSKKTKIFQIKNSDIFHISAQNIDCGYSLEPPRRGGSNEYPQSMFYAEIRKIMYTPVNPSFTI